MIFDIKRFAVHDGNGIRTTVFFKGCPLKCVWCHNPEGIGFKSQTAYYEDKCVCCGSCVSVCKNGAQKIIDGKHVFERERCAGCAECEKVCPQGAVKVYGENMTTEEVEKIVLKDKDFYESSGGGVTLSGGECLMQPEFCKDILKRLKEKNINTAVDTCGFVSREAIDKVIDYTDMFLYDIKAFDEDVHIKCCGHSNKIILDNLLYINSRNIETEIRIPYVYGFNDNQTDKIFKFLSDLKCISAVKILPYHNYAGSKYKALNMENTLPEMIDAAGQIEKARKKASSYGLVCK